MPHPPVLWDIESDPALAGTKLIAEAWDAAGLYQVGSFIGDAWKEWNGRFRDDVRSFFRGEDGTVARSGRPAAGQSGGLRPQAARSRSERQLRHLPRRILAERSRLLRPQAQRGQRRRQPRRRRRQPQLELRRRGTDRRSGDRAAAQPPGEELADGDAALARHADAAHGRRGAAHAGREQQRLLPRRREQLVRLDAGGEARRRPAVRQPAHRAADAARRDARAPAPQPHRDAAAGQDRVARRDAAAAGLERRSRTAWRSAPRCAREGAGAASDHERVLGAARLRAAGRAGSRAVAAMDRYLARLARRHRRVADGAGGRRSALLSRGPAFGRGAVAAARAVGDGAS